MAATRFSKPSPCAGIRLGATLSLWRRVHCVHVAWQAWGMVRPGHRFAWQAAGIGRVGGVSRVCRVAVPWGLGSGARFVHAWSTCFSRGRLRGSCVLGGVPRVCRGRAGSAVPWGLGSGRVAHAHDFTRCDLRFAWQVWDFGCTDALGKALDGGSAWQAQ